MTVLQWEVLMTTRFLRKFLTRKQGLVYSMYMGKYLINIWR